MLFLQITSVGFQNKTIGSNIALTNALSTTTKTMANINSVIRPEGVAKNMQEFQKANMQMEMTEEMSNLFFLLRFYFLFS